MVKKTSLLLYEKEKNLNMILEEQIFKTGHYDIQATVNQTKLTELLDSFKPSILILNFDGLSTDLKNAIQSFTTKNKNSSIIGYHTGDLPCFKFNNSNLKTLTKPFKIIKLLEVLKKIKTSKVSLKKDISITSHLKFICSKRVLYNLKTHKKEHLTEKENNLLFYFYNHKNIEINKNELLNEIWGFSETIKTHTLETHIYRLKLKLRRLEPNLPFTLYNRSGLYIMKFNKNN